MKSHITVITLGVYDLESVPVEGMGWKTMLLSRSCAFLLFDANGREWPRISANGRESFQMVGS
ncbi:MAG TPA: hypothetical protein PLA50_09025 [Bacteroidia bacterium]|nr:hypothetical protein [Bacteroidia bacterium]